MEVDLIRSKFANGPEFEAEVTRRINADPRIQRIRIEAARSISHVRHQIGLQVARQMAAENTTKFLTRCKLAGVPRMESTHERTGRFRNTIEEDEVGRR